MDRIGARAGPEHGPYPKAVGLPLSDRLSCVSRAAFVIPILLAVFSTSLSAKPDEPGYPAITPSASGHIEHQEHAHDPLPEDGSLSLAEAVSTALAAWPARVEIPAMRAEADAWSRRGQSWLSGRPAFSLRYQTDGFGSDDGLREYEAGLSLPLWNWGGRDATRSVGDAFISQADAYSKAMRWQVAGEVRQLLWNIALAISDLELVEQALANAQTVTDLVDRSYELGEVALRDALMAQSALLEARAAVIDASAGMLDAEREFRSVTGMNRRPPFEPEALSTQHEIPETHPALAITKADLSSAEAEQAMVGRNNGGNPHLLIGPRRERSPLASDYDDSLGVTVQVPFGGGSHRDVEITGAARKVASAQAALLQQQRTLELQLHEAAHRLDVINQNLEEASQRMTLAERQHEMGLVAYEKGELDLIDLLKLQDNALAARRNLAWLQIDHHRQTALYNQAVGEVP